MEDSLSGEKDLNFICGAETLESMWREVAEQKKSQVPVQTEPTTDSCVNMLSAAVAGLLPCAAEPLKACSGMIPCAAEPLKACSGMICGGSDK